jgi:hypothetical protein
MSLKSKIKLSTSKKIISKYKYKKILALTAREVFDNLKENGINMSIKRCRKYTHKIIKNKYKITDI